MYLSNVKTNYFSFLLFCACFYFGLKKNVFKFLINFFLSHNIADMEFRSSRARLLWDKWRYVWMLAWERQRRLHEHQLYLQDLERVRMFSWEDWRKRFLKFMNHKKSRLTDLFRKMDKNNDGLIPREIFIDGIINTSKFVSFELFEELFLKHVCF